jgi:signal transduction histidine kinase
VESEARRARGMTRDSNRQRERSERGGEDLKLSWRAPILHHDDAQPAEYTVVSALATARIDRETREAREPTEEETLTRGEVLRFLYTCPQAILMTTLQGQVRLMSARAVSLLIPLSESGAIDDVFQLFERHEPRFRERLAESMAQPERRLEGLRIKVSEGPRGALAWIEVSAVPFDGGYSLTCHDATAAVEREARYLAAVADEAHQRGKTETASSILHDLGNTLTGIGGCVVDARRQVSDASVVMNLHRVEAFLRPHAEQLDRILGAGRGKALVDLLASLATAADDSRGDALASMERVVTHLTHANEVLSIHRAYAGSGCAASKGRTSVEQLFLDAKAMSSSSIAKRGASLIFAAHGAPLPRVRVDRSRLMQVLLNLIKNAAEALDELTDRSAPQIVTVSATVEADSAVTIAVRDTGAGFPKSRAERLFDHGFSTKQRGSGIGLSACKKIVESFGGTLTLTSEGVGMGALAKLYLPREVVSLEQG